MYFIQDRVVFMVGIIALISIIASLSLDNFATTANFNTIIFNISIDAIVGIGMMLMLIAGVFDLSIGSIVGFAGALTAYLIMKAGINPWVAGLFAITCSSGIGLFNGFMVAIAGVNHLIVGLVMMGIIRGINLLITGAGITDLPDTFFQFTNISILGFRLPVWYMLILCLIFTFLLNRTIFFRRFYFLGGYEKAAALSGINVKKMKMTAFTISGCLAGLGGVLMASKFSGAIPSLGLGMEMKLITACVLGGASIAGGYGSILGVVLGVLFMGVVTNLMVVAVVPISWQGIIISGILLIAVTLDAIINQDRV
jgi:ribose transport system permease protein